MQRYDELKSAPRRWLVTGAAGFIGSSIVERLLTLGQEVAGLDNYSTGSPENIKDVMGRVGPAAREHFTMVEGDIRNPADCERACRGVQIVLHQAALGSVPRSVADPAATNSVNVDGFIKMALAARDAGAKRFVYASSSSVYGDSQVSPKREADIGRPLSPYAVSKKVNEDYAHVFSALYGLETIGLRYFNVFGMRQDPEGPYAAVIPRWISRLMRGEACIIYGDGLTSRDFCYVENAVLANILAGSTTDRHAINRVYNVSFGQQTDLNALYTIIVKGLTSRLGREFPATPQYEDFRQGDVRASLADIGAAREALHYQPEYSLAQGMELALDWYIEHLGEKAPRAMTAPV